MTCSPSRGEIVPTYRPSRLVNFDRARWERALQGASYVQRGPGFGEANVGGYGYLFLGNWKAPDVHPGVAGARLPADDVDARLP